MDEKVSVLESNALVRSLMAGGELSREKLEKVENAMTVTGLSLVRALLNNAISSKTILKHAMKISTAPVFDPKSMEMDINNKELNSLVSMAEMEKDFIYPLRKSNGVLYLAVVDPTNTQTIDRLRFKSRSIVQPILVDAGSFDYMLSATGGVDRRVIEGELAKAGTEGASTGASDVVSFNLAIKRDDPPIVKFINGVLADAISKGASDLHFEPYEKSYRIRFRIDGVLQEMYAPPESHRDQISARIKVMSQLDITERRKPQDGRIKVVSGNRVIDFRVSILPTLWGEKIVMRILDSSASKLNIDILGFTEVQKQAILEGIHRPQGMVLVTGPTGSGKTVTLYTCMGILNNPQLNLSTAEDPVEINLEGINQVAVNPGIGFTFAEALRSFLRQDPDVIMVGEIRDLETADIAIKAAQTGHLVLSTLHTNSAPETLTRLINMGVEPFNIASTVHLIIAQRLARRLCSCKEEVLVDADYLERLGFSRTQATSRIYGPVGCDNCTRGYKGRVGIYEVMPISETMERLILGEATALDIADQAREDGVDSIRQSAIKKVLEGVTSIEELLRVTSD